MSVIDHDFYWCEYIRDGPEKWATSIYLQGEMPDDEIE